MTYFKNKKIVKQDNGKMTIVNKKNIKDGHTLPSEWSISDKKLHDDDIHKLNKALKQKKKRNSKK